MSTENEDSNHESLNTTIKGQNCNNILTNEKIHTSNTYNINSEVQNQENQLPKLNNKARASNTSLNINNFEDEVDENKTIYEINFPLKEEDIKKNANRIKTTKYNIFTFIPLNLWSQVKYNIHAYI